MAKPRIAPADQPYQQPKQQPKNVLILPADQSTWPKALRAVRARLEPWTLLWRYWRAWSSLPPPPELHALLEAVQGGQPLYLYDPG